MGESSPVNREPVEAVCWEGRGGWLVCCVKLLQHSGADWIFQGRAPYA